MTKETYQYKSFLRSNQSFTCLYIFVGHESNRLKPQLSRHSARSGTRGRPVYRRNGPDPHPRKLPKNTWLTRQFVFTCSMLGSVQMKFTKCSDVVACGLPPSVQMQSPLFLRKASHIQYDNVDFGPIRHHTSNSVSSWTVIYFSVLLYSIRRTHFHANLMYAWGCCNHVHGEVP